MQTILGSSTIPTFCAVHKAAWGRTAYSSNSSLRGLRSYLTPTSAFIRSICAIKSQCRPPCRHHRHSGSHTRHPVMSRCWATYHPRWMTRRCTDTRDAHPAACGTMVAVKAPRGVATRSLGSSTRFWARATWPEQGAGAALQLPKTTQKTLLPPLVLVCRDLPWASPSWAVTRYAVWRGKTSISLIELFTCLKMEIWKFHRFSSIILPRSTSPRRGPRTHKSSSVEIVPHRLGRAATQEQGQGTSLFLDF